MANHISIDGYTTNKNNISLMFDLIVKIKAHKNTKGILSTKFANL